MKNVLTIAGFDPSSGAGITRDLDVFFSLGLHGIAVPACVVNQGPTGVTGVFPVPDDQFTYMLDTVKSGVRIDGLKIGVMCDEPHVEFLFEFISSARMTGGLSGKTEPGKSSIPIVLDPVIAAKNNKRLLTDRGLKKLIEKIIPLVTVVTPNIDEAVVITGKNIDNIDNMKDCATAIFDMGTKAVLIKGGHLEGDPIDLLYNGNEYFTWKRERLGRHIHGTGCTFSAALLSFLVSGNSLKDAFDKAEKYMQHMMNKSYRIADKGYYYMSSAAN